MVRIVTSDTLPCPTKLPAERLPGQHVIQGTPTVSNNSNVKRGLTITTADGFTRNSSPSAARGRRPEASTKAASLAAQVRAAIDEEEEEEEDDGDETEMDEADRTDALPAPLP